MKLMQGAASLACWNRSHAGRPDADEHLDELPRGDREESHPGLADDRAGPYP